MVKTDNTQEKRVQSTIESLEWIYGVVIALSIGEAFTQFAQEPTPGTTGIQWDGFFSLCSLLLLVVPFCHGMSRYFCDMYDRKQIGPHYGIWLLIDCFAFTIEAGLFFILAQSLPENLWAQFSVAVIILLFWDVLWGAFIWRYRTSVIGFWVIVNLVTIPFLAAVLLGWHKGISWCGAPLGCVVILARTFADYWMGWEFYFPGQQTRSRTRTRFQCERG